MNSGRNYPIQLGMQGDVRNTLRRMLEAAETTSARTEWVSRVQEMVQNWKESVSEKVNSERLPMLPERLCRETHQIIFRQMRSLYPIRGIPVFGPAR